MGLKAQSVSFKLLVLAAVFQLASIVLDQVIISVDGRLQNLTHRLESDANLLSELEFKREVGFKEWNSLHSAMDRMSSSQSSINRAFERELDFSQNLLRFLTSFATNESYARDYQPALNDIRLIGDTALASGVEDTIEAQFERVDKAHYAISAKVSDLINELIQRKDAAQIREAQLNLNRHFMLLASVAFQVSGLLMLVLFFIVQFKARRTETRPVADTTTETDPEEMP